MRSGVDYVPNAKIALVGEAWGEHEERAGKPFIGYSGQLLTRMLHGAGINREDCTVTNVICKRPIGNNFAHFCVGLGDRQPDWPEPFRTPITRTPRAMYLKEEYWPEVYSLWEEVKAANVIIPLGNTATWAIGGFTASISKHRGVWTPSIPGPKFLATYHPAAVTREYSLYVICIADFLKAKEGQDTSTFSRPSRKIHVAESEEDLQYIRAHIGTRTTLDIETDRKDLNNLFISCVGFSPTSDLAYVVPFVRRNRMSYWKTDEEELCAWDLVRDVCESTSITKILHRAIYDRYVLRRFAGIEFRGRIEDSLVAHHALYPELPKSLGFIGSILTEEPAWKLERGTRDEKREE